MIECWPSTVVKANHKLLLDLVYDPILDPVFELILDQAVNDVPLSRALLFSILSHNPPR